MVWLRGGVIVGVERGQESGQVIHFHAAVDHHVPSQGGTQHPLRKSSGTEDPIDRVPDPQFFDSGISKPEATSHFGTAFHGANLVDEVTDGHRGSLECDLPIDRGCDPVSGGTIFAREERCRIEECDRDLLHATANVFRHVMGRHVFFAITQVGIVAAHFSGAVGHVRTGMPELVSLILHVVPAHPPFEHGAGHSGHLRSDGDKDRPVAQCGEPVLKRKVSRFEESVRLFERKAQFAGFFTMGNGLGDVRRERLHFRLPVSGVGLAIEIARSHAEIFFGFHLHPIQIRGDTLRREATWPWEAMNSSSLSSSAFPPSRYSGRQWLAGLVWGILIERLKIKEDGRMGRVDGKVVIVTGGASGLGAADARALAAEGASVILTDIDVARGEALADDIGAEFFEHDVSDEEAWRRLMDETVARHGGLDALVNNAGIAIVADIERTTTDIWRRTLAVHLDGTFFGCRHALPAMADSGGGSLINMSSTAALAGYSPYFAYSAAKGGIRSLTKSIAAHCRVKRNGVRCNSVHPGSIDTPMVHEALASLGLPKPEGDHYPEEQRRQIGLGEPEDVAHMVVFLASDESKHISGSEMVIDNGDAVVQITAPGGTGG